MIQDKRALGPLSSGNMTKDHGSHMYVFLHYELTWFIVLIKLVFCNVFVMYLFGFLIVDQLFFDLINTLIFTKYSNIRPFVYKSLRTENNPS